jgi:hypothetical protein
MPRSRCGESFPDCALRGASYAPSPSVKGTETGNANGGGMTKRIGSNQAVIFDALSLLGAADRRNCPGKLFQALDISASARKVPAQP